MHTPIEPVLIPQTIYDEMVTHARAGKPEEICGVVCGRGLEAYEVIRGQNLAVDRVNNYEVDPQTLLLQFKFEDTGDEMMGIYHSHPISVAYPSATDAWNAHYPDAVYFICSLEDDDAPVIRAFRMITHFIDTHFPDVDVAALKEAIGGHEMRPGTNIFAHFQSETEDVAAALMPIAQKVAPPFYLVLHEEDAAVDDARVVMVREHPIRLID